MKDLRKSHWLLNLKIERDWQLKMIAQDHRHSILANIFQIDGEQYHRVAKRHPLSPYHQLRQNSLH